MKSSAILILGMLLLGSCMDESEVDFQNVKIFEPSKEELFMRGISDVSFEYDYLVPTANRMQKKRTKEQWQAQKVAGNGDQEVMKKKYPVIKEGLIAWNGAADEKRNSVVIQQIALKYLRNYFLLLNNDQSIAESKFLMALLIENEAIDLDVLTDGFLHVKNELILDIQLEYEFYIRKLYILSSREVLQNADDVRSSYAAANGDTKFKFLKDLKNLERLSASCDYTKKVMNF